MRPQIRAQCVSQSQPRYRAALISRFGQDEGATLDRRRKAPSTAEGFYLEPTFLPMSPTTFYHAKDEIFGPVMSVRDFKVEARPFRRANATSLLICWRLHLRSDRGAPRCIGLLEAGSCFINSYNGPRRWRPRFGGRGKASWRRRRELLGGGSTLTAK